jgi:hypothetical protein
MMNPSINKTVLCSILSCLAVFMLQCGSAPTQTAGGASGTEVSGCIIAGQAIDSLGNPLQGAIARLRPLTYLTGESANDSDFTIQDRVTGADGRCRFDSVAVGQYLVEFTYVDTMGEVQECGLSVVDSLQVLPPAVLRSMAVIAGTLAVEIPMSEQPRARVFGLERSAPIDSNGHFEMRVPFGWRRLNLPGSDASQPRFDTLVFLQPGERFGVKPPSPPNTFCDSLGCEREIVRALLDTNGLQALAVESVTVIVNDHVIELRLRNRGIRSLPSTVTHLPHLRVLDAGQNMLDSIPPEIGQLRDLSALYADRNMLWMVPASIGMLRNLRELDLSGNRLQSLPEPITFLTPGVTLRLGNNMLCNIGEFTARWADQYDRRWRELQKCM